MFTILVFLKYCIVHSEAQQPIVNSTQHDIGDTFNITCDVTRFDNAKEIPGRYQWAELSLHRKSFVTLTSIPLVIYLPNADLSFIDGEIKSNFFVKHNPRNQWLFQRNRKTSNHCDSSQLSIIEGWQRARCEPETTRHSSILATNMRITSISDHKIQINLHNGNDSYSSYNYVEENIILTCTVTGPPSLLITWKQTAKNSTKENPATGDISSNSTYQSGCDLHHYSSELDFELQETDDGNTYYCIVSNDTGEQSRENFTLRIIPAIKSTSQPESQSAVTGVFTFFVGMLLCLASAIALMYYFGIRKKRSGSQDDKPESGASVSTFY
ncbi:hypothetical protein Bpfe_001266 [Biomphalaria pfeifferi]|uniref:Ig-like domain-containing protein n=1 Tax=Biomphalaria pfeifferi TaxID=112525 RepID=A0AAD8CB65_BIOPF|nr:hypothetical protein Bpfe_001266 [Biomphalaria pfeifferi]